VQFEIVKRHQTCNNRRKRKSQQFNPMIPIHFYNLISVIFWAFPCGSGYPFPSFLAEKAKKGCPLLSLKREPPFIKNFFDEQI
jgi:hypothetical protein